MRDEDPHEPRCPSNEPRSTVDSSRPHEPGKTLGDGPPARAVTVKRWLLRGGLLVILVAVALYVFVEYRHEFSLDRLAQREVQFRQTLQTYPLPTYAASFVLYVAVTALALPFAAVMSLVYGWLFGFWTSLLLVSFASTTGATCSFLLSRYILGDAIQQRFGERLRTFNESLDREGPFFLFTLRLVPLVPFFVINVVMGLTRIRTRTFWWVSQLGMLPGTVVYLFAGSSVKSLNELSQQGIGSLLTPQLAVAFLLLGLFPLAVKYLLRALGKGKDA